MENRAWTTIDKSGLERGEWDDEPDKMQFTDEATGFPCLIVRNGSGALCGYVGVNNNHKYFGKEYNDCDVRVHGGLTFANLCSPVTDESHGIFHVVEDGEDDKVWWLGFDMAHLGDLCPEMIKWSKNHGFGDNRSSEVYRNIAYVKEQCAYLAKQLKEVAA